MDQQYSLFTDGKCLQLPESGLKNYRDSRGRYGLWIDLEMRMAYELHVGELDIFRKRILGRLLCFLITNVPRRYTAVEIFESVWAADYDDIFDFRTVKTSISRLRAMLESNSPSWQYILKTDPSFLGRGGEYYFNPAASYCMICPRNVLKLFS